jgi:hypothetical protein
MSGDDGLSLPRSGKTWGMPEQLRKWSLTRGTVIKHMHYGLRVQVPSGEIGVVDRVEIADVYVDPADWPAVGTGLRARAGSSVRSASSVTTCLPGGRFPPPRR